jgi:hypothetical protein
MDGNRNIPTVSDMENIFLSWGEGLSAQFEDDTDGLLMVGFAIEFAHPHAAYAHGGDGKCGFTNSSSRHLDGNHEGFLA